MKKILLVFALMFMFACSKEPNKPATGQEVNTQVPVSQKTPEKSENTQPASTDKPAETPPKVKQVQEIKNTVKVAGIKTYREARTFIEIALTKDIDDKFDPISYIKINPAIECNVSKVENKMILNGDFDPDKEYTITLLKGIKARDGSVTDTDYTEKVVFNQKEPKISFSSDGIILPSVNEKKVFIRTMNVNNVKVTIKKVYENNTTQFLQSFNFSGNGSFFNYNNDYYDYDDEDGYSSSNGGNLDNVGDTIYTKEFPIENDKNHWVQSAIDLTGILDNNGVYMIDVEFGEKDTSYTFPIGTDDYVKSKMFRNNGNISKALLLTDTGIIAQKTSDGLNATVMDIMKNTPISGAKVILMSRNNQVLEEKTTDANGDVKFDYHSNSFYIIVDSNGSKSLLVLRSPLNTNGFDVDGVYATNGIRGFIYTERGVYRPGDPVYVSIIARNNKVPLQDGQPVTISIFTPTGAKFKDNEVIKDGKKGFYTYMFKTDVSSQTGIWKLIATIGEETITKNISVEAVAPYKIKATLDIPDVIDSNSSAMSWSLNAKYLFGTPANGLKYQVEYQGREDVIDFPKYRDYVFRTPSSYSYGFNDNTEGTLDENGNASISPDLSNFNFDSLNMILSVTGRVIEDSGRPVITTKYVKVKKFDTYVGIENTVDYKRPGDKLGLKVIAVSEDGEKLVPGKKLVYRIYNNSYSWWWDYNSYDSFIRSLKTDKNTKLLEEKEFTSGDTPYIIDYTIPKSGYLYVEVEDTETNQTTGINMYADEWADPSTTKKIETLAVTTDKKKYTSGDKAIIKYKGVEGAKALITIEQSGKILKRYLKDAGNSDMTEEIEITKDMAPNVYVYVTLLQDYNKKENDRPLRLYGIVPLMVEEADTKIDLAIDSPESVRPNEKFTVKIKNQKNTKVDFTVAVVDEGLLDITAFKTPAPWEYFFKKVASALTMYDNYSEIIGKPYGYVHQILKVGGDDVLLLDEMARNKRLKDLGLEDADRFVPVSMFKGVLTTDDNGEASVDFDMPNYMGSVRIMVIAANENSYGSAEKTMLVKAPIVVQPSLPRTMKVGDKLMMPVNIFGLEEGIGDVEIIYTFKGKTQTQTVNIAKGEKKTVYFEDTVGNEVSHEKVTIAARSKVYNYEETVGMAVNSNSAPIQISENKVLEEKESVEFKQEQDYVKGTVESVLTISSTPILGIDQRLKYLIHYPYGCVEQTTSSVFPQLFIDRLSTNKNYDKKEVVSNINAGIGRLRQFQLNDGSFSYWPGEGETSSWATNYVGQFLIYAKKNGYYVPDSMFIRWRIYTDSTVRSEKGSDNYSMAWKAYALYLLALSGDPNISEMNYMHENVYNDMNLISRMYLAAAYKLVGEDKIAMDMASKIKFKDIKYMYDSIYNSDRRYYSYSYGSVLREMAVYLDCYHTIFGKVDEEAYDEILLAMRSRSWYSTQSVGYSLMALAGIATANDNKDIKGIVDIDGQQKEYTAKGQYRLSIPQETKNIKVLPDTDGRTYVNYYWDGVPVNNIASDYYEGFTMDRNFYDNTGKMVDPLETKTGDSFWMELIVYPDTDRLENGGLDNIAITQILPSGWEIENLRVTGTRPPKWVEDRMNETQISYTDIRDDRIMWFFNYDGTRAYNRFYVKINVVTKGEFEFPGTKLEAMYDNDYRAYMKGFRVQVK